MLRIPYDKEFINKIVNKKKNQSFIKLGLRVMVLK